MSTDEDVKAVVPAPRRSEENGPPDRTPEPESEPDRTSEPGRRSPSTARRRARTGGIAAVVLVLVLGGAQLLVRAEQLHHTPTAVNRALTDAEATTEVIGDVSSALVTVFSYTPATTGTTRQAARRLLAGRAARQYAELFGQVEKRAARQKLTLTTHVVRAAVTRLTGHSARLLVFLDQVAERGGKSPATVAAQLSVTAELRGGHWQIIDIASHE